jgi:ubiquinone/menaquinone biosynthesis C-methylase UbiE
MCTIPDLPAALAELRRVLKPGGTLRFVEHGLAPDEKVQRWQHRLEPVQKRLFGGCHLTRPIAEQITAAGFTITELDRFYEDGSPKFLGADSLGVAAAPSRPPGPA